MRTLKPDDSWMTIGAVGTQPASQTSRSTEPREKRALQSLADVQALVFDVFGSVVDWRSGASRASALSFAATRRATIRSLSPMHGADIMRRRSKRCAWDVVL